ncbi:NAD-dependent epimerase/dehydratase family protein [Acidianus sp. RZ1]|uniref:NAD-dependent epimerase/dehydratase family protein n=1 Tax=Acidianus sp. RZ1 TaxID=1540082 RepID=UPI0014918B91|nr:NAD-dependent epimerase/dehydratase family protein [Acidianus sp. RZ1]NON63187.1 NAD-dependent epimerase/dehydratase family protein [Acidianus sp. RZ1]
MRYLLLGLGFISMHVADFLTPENEVVITYRNLNSVKERYLKILDGRVTPVKLDPLDNFDVLKKYVSWSDVVVNTVGEISGDQNALRRANVDVPSAVTKAISETGNRMLIHLSGLPGLVGEGIRPEHPHLFGVTPKTEFEKTKVEGEKVVYKASTDIGFPSAIIRPTLVYGKYSAHVQYVSIYNLARRGLVPKLGISFNAISAQDLSRMVEILSEMRPQGMYFYATECSKVSITKFFEIMAKALGKRSIKLPVPTFLAKAFLPSYVKPLLKYTRSSFDCTNSVQLVKNLEFRENEVIENALFLDELRRSNLLIPT